MRRVRRPLLALVTLLMALAVGYGFKAADGGSGSSPSPSRSVPGSASSTGAVALSQLPPQARETVALIRAGGPFPYPTHDGAVFRNAEHHLPREPSGYYREYTVPTPGSSDRGARRIITGAHGEYYYTDDHYASFRAVDVGR